MANRKEMIVISRLDALFILGVLDAKKGRSSRFDEIAERLAHELEYD